MKKWLLFLCAGIMAVQSGEPPATSDAAKSRIMDAIEHRASALFCVTPQPVFMAPAAAQMCGGPVWLNKEQIHLHENRYIKVFITPSAKKILLNGKGDYPEGTLIVKEKCRDAAAKETELFTAMVKRERGYNLMMGDWEFMVLDRAGGITASGRIDSCMECHLRFSQTDFVSRVYVPRPISEKL